MLVPIAYTLHTAPTAPATLNRLVAPVSTIVFSSSICYFHYAWLCVTTVPHRHSCASGSTPRGGCSTNGAQAIQTTYSAPSSCLPLAITWPYRAPETPKSASIPSIASFFHTCLVCALIALSRARFSILALFVH